MAAQVSLGAVARGPEVSLAEEAATGTGRVGSRGEKSLLDKALWWEVGADSREALGVPCRG